MLHISSQGHLAEVEVYFCVCFYVCKYKQANLTLVYHILKRSELLYIELSKSLTPVSHSHLLILVNLSFFCPEETNYPRFHKKQDIVCGSGGTRLMVSSSRSMTIQLIIFQLF